jgi:hypothetical protein
LWPFSDFLNLLPAIPVLLAHLAGMVVAIILVFRPKTKRTAGLLALSGFALLVILDLAEFAQGPLIRLLSNQTARGIRLAHVSVGCCCGAVDIAAVVCLIVAMWQTMSSNKA